MSNLHLPLCVCVCVCVYRRGTIRVLGLLGALDPYKHKMNVGAIKIQEDTGVAVISITEPKTDDLSPGTVCVLVCVCAIYNIHI